VIAPALLLKPIFPVGLVRRTVSNDTKNRPQTVAALPLPGQTKEIRDHRLAGQFTTPPGHGRRNIRSLRQRVGKSITRSRRQTPAAHRPGLLMNLAARVLQTPARKARNHSVLAFAGEELRLARQSEYYAATRCLPLADASSP